VAFHPDVREASSRHRAPALRLEPVRQDAGCRGPALLQAPELRPEPAIQRRAERRDVWCRGQPLPTGSELRLEQVLPRPVERLHVRPALASLMAWAWVSAPGEPPALRVSASSWPSGQALPWGLADLQVQAPLMAQASASQPDEPELRLAPGAAQRERAAAGAAAEVASARAAAQAAEVVASEHAAAEAESAHAAAEPQPGAASVAWVRQVVAAAEEGPVGSRAAGVAASGVPVRQPAEVQRADAAVQPPGATRPGAWEQQAGQEAALPGAQRVVVPSVLPSEAASVFRQGPSRAGPVRPRAAARFAHELRSLQIASRSGPSWRAARNEGWSCG
jgi:hypothetical protein